MNLRNIKFLLPIILIGNMGYILRLKPKARPTKKRTSF